MFGFFKREKQVELLLQRYTEVFVEATDRFESAFGCYLSGVAGEALAFEIEQMHKAESRADDVRNDVEVMMFEKALIPEAREDVLNLLEDLDAIPGDLQRLLYMVYDQRIVMPVFMKKDVAELVRLSVECCKALMDYVRKLLEGGKDMGTDLKALDDVESRCDHIERRLIRDVFASDVEGVERLMLRDCVARLAQISDDAHRVGRLIYILSVKRLV